MSIRLLLFLFVGLHLFKIGFSQDHNDSLLYRIVLSKDLSNVINPDSIIDDEGKKYKRPDPLGFMDTNFYRLYIHFTSFKQSRKNPIVYNINGKTKFKNNICAITGTLVINTAEFDSSRLMY